MNGCHAFSAPNLSRFCYVLLPSQVVGAVSITSSAAATAALDAYGSQAVFTGNVILGRVQSGAYTNYNLLQATEGTNTLFQVCGLQDDSPVGVSRGTYYDRRCKPHRERPYLKTVYLWALVACLWPPP